MIQKINPMLLIDGYKADHRRQYPEGTEYIYSNFTPRQSRIPGVNSIVFFGLQYFLKEYLVNKWNSNFFNRSKYSVVNEYKYYMDNYLGKDAINCEHIGALHDLGYLPLHIKALPEGSVVPVGVPVLTIVNTMPEFFWLTNYIETLISNILWKPITSATIAHQYRKRFADHAKRVGYGTDILQWQCHDFSFRGMSGLEDALLSASGHLLSFTGTDTFPALHFIEHYYNSPAQDSLVGGSVPATEHSVMCMGGDKNELDTIERLITEIYPSGIVSIVADSWDFWAVLTDILPKLKDKILARDGRSVIRPDSGNPVDIITGIGSNDTPQDKGAYEMLWDIFGGTINEHGYKVLNPKVGLIYGDSITLERQDQILSRLEEKGFSASNLVLGVGSFTYEYVTRDTFGFAMKATWGQVNGEHKDIYKNPKTDSGFKKSAKGLLRVYKENNTYKLQDMCTQEEELTTDMRTVFLNGNINTVTFEDIRDRLSKNR